MSKAEVSYVQYFVPSDGDSEDHPNVFVVRKAPKVLTVADIVSSFPLPGEYLFRAKMPFGKTHVWLDLNSGDETIPQFGTKFILKVSRISLGVAGVSKGGAGGGVAAVAVAPAPTGSARSSSGAGATATPVATARAPVAPSSDASQQPRPAAPKAPEPQQRQQQEHASDDLLGMLGGGSSSSSSSSSSSAPSTSRGSTGGGGGGGGGLGLDLLGNSLGGGVSAPVAPINPVSRPTPAAPYVDPFAAPPPPSKSATQAPPKPASSNILSGDIFSM